VSGALVLPEPVRQRVVSLAADTLGRLGPDEIPGTLRAAARFTPNKRARLAASALAAALAGDQLFRLRTAESAEAEAPAVADAVRRGEVPAAADPVELAAVAYLVRPDGWEEYVRRAAESLRAESEQAHARERDEAMGRLRAQLDEARAAVRDEARRSAEQVEAARAELDALRKRLRAQTGELRAAQRARAEAEEALAEERRRAAVAESTAQAEIRRLRQRVAEMEDALEAARRSARESRSADETRLWLLLETAEGAVRGLRRELALRPTEDRPGDAVAAALPGAGGPGAGPPADVLFDRLLVLPTVHLVVDGYNVTKTGYGSLPLATQRDRLVQSLGVLAARTGAEVTCAFDGADRPPVMPPAPRGVRVLFSRPGETADDLIRRLVAAEPPGRPVVVVSSDREVSEGVRRSGAYPVAADILLRRLDRG
jgi:predicted RNA-binding protein with PIN domain